jgi:WD40 repeat protein
MNNPGDSLQIDENLARMLAACDQAMDGADPKAPTINVPRTPLPGERAVGDLSGNAPHEGSLADLLPDSSRNGLSPESQTPIHTPAPGNGTHRVGRFELRRQLGKGGCGIVFLAFDPKLEREVALKIPRPEMLLSQDARRRLVREALAAAEFDHPNLVPVYETGEIGPICFIATAFCPGLTLGEWLERQAFPVPVRQAARLVATVAEAVQHAHDRGVLHRDLKPNNVILQATKEDPNETEPPPGSCHLRGDCIIPRVVDFGLAKLLERGGPSETNTRQILGTPKYMAPEQAQARREDIGPAADVYALGVILYEMLTGRAPYEGETDVEVLRQAIDGNFTQPRRLRPDVPRDLEAICVKAMDRVPGLRYRTAIDLADDLRRFLDGKPTLARPLKWPARAARWLRRNDQAVALVVLAAVATLLLALGSWSMYQTRQLKSDRDTVLQKQAERTKTDQQRDYAQNVRAAYLAWRAGDSHAAADYLEAARRLARTGGDTTDFPHAYLARLVEAEKLAIACPAGAITALAVAPDGSRLATGHADGTLAIWDAKTGEPVASVRAHPGSVAVARFTRPGEVATTDAAGRATSWVIGGTGLTPGGKPAGLPDTGTQAVLVARHGNLVFTAGEDGIVRAYDSAEEADLFPALALARPPLAVAVHTDGRTIAISTAEPSVQTFRGTRPGLSLATGSRRFDLLRFTPEGQLIGAEVRERAVAVYAIDATVRERLVSVPPGPVVGVASVDLSTDQPHVAIGDDRGRFSVWSVADRAFISTVETGSATRVSRVALSSDGRLVAAVVPGGIRLWNANDPNPISTLAVEDASLLRFLPAGDRLVTVGRGSAVRVWSVAGGVEEFTLYGHVGRVTGIGVSPDGRTLATGSAGGEVKFWDLRTGQELMAFRRHSGAVTHLEFAANGKLLATGAEAARGAGELVQWLGAKE